MKRKKKKMNKSYWPTPYSNQLNQEMEKYTEKIESLYEFFCCYFRQIYVCVL